MAATLDCGTRWGRCGVFDTAWNAPGRQESEPQVNTEFHPRFMRLHCFVVLYLLGVGSSGKSYLLLDLGFLVTGGKKAL